MSDTGPVLLRGPDGAEYRTTMGEWHSDTDWLTVVDEHGAQTREPRGGFTLATAGVPFRGELPILPGVIIRAYGHDPRPVWLGHDQLWYTAGRAGGITAAALKARITGYDVLYAPS